MDTTLELKEKLNNYIFEMLREDNFKQNISTMLKEELHNTILLKKQEIFNLESYKEIKEKVKSSMTYSIKSKSFKKELYNFIEGSIKSLENSNLTLGNVIPPALLSGLKVYIYNHRDEIIASFKKLFSSKDVEKKINEEITSILNGINPMISRFISTNTIYSKLVSGLNEYLDNEKNVIDIINAINGLLDNSMKKKVSEFIIYFPKESRKSLTDSLCNNILNNILSERFIDMTIGTVEEKLKCELSLLSKDSEILNSNIDNLVDTFMKNNYPNLLEKQQLKDNVNTLSSDIADNFLEKPLKDFIK